MKQHWVRKWPWDQVQQTRSRSISGSKHSAIEIQNLIIRKLYERRSSWALNKLTKENLNFDPESTVRELAMSPGIFLTCRNTVWQDFLNKHP